ncbi:MAG: histidinol-phosphate transaminase [Clostridia bacterium]|nr:histidinol-phosphate transaminase [Clostridia bacterium]
MSKFMTPRLSGLTPYVPGEQPQAREFIKLNTNESPFPPSPAAVAAVTETLLNGLRRYNDPGAAALREAIAAPLGLSPDQVVAGNGSDEILGLAFQAFCPGKTTVFPDVTYGFYRVLAGLYGLDCRAAPLSEDLTVRVEDYLQPGENVVLANPNAPTGLALPLADVERILRAHPDDVVLIDEAYVDFGGESSAALIPQYENLLVVQTCSKSRSLAGARLGFALGSPALCGDLQRLRNSFHPYNVNAVTQAMAVASFGDTAYFSACTADIIATRRRFTGGLRGLGFLLSDSSANFVFAKSPRTPGREVYLRLKERGVLVRWFDQDRIRDYVRISIGSGEDMARVLKLLQEEQL